MTRDSSQAQRKDQIDRRRVDRENNRASPGSSGPRPPTDGERSTGEAPTKLDYNPKLDGLPVLPKPTRDRLTRKQLIDYKSHREKLLLWMLNRGKEPDKGKGYSWETVRCRAYNTDIFYRWVWQEHDRYTTQIDRDDADGYFRELVTSEQSSSNKQNIEKSIKMLTRWRDFQFGENWSSWEPPVTFKDAHGPEEPQDYLTREERTLIREASLDYGTVPHYNSLSAEQRDEWREHLAHRFRMPKRDVGKEEFERANGFKIPSLVCTSLDAGLRPKEVATAKPEWIDTSNAILRIPYDESVKNQGNWHVSLRDDTAEYLQMWKEERQLYEKYDDTDRLWLTRERNPYRSTALKYILERLCNQVGIKIEDRKMTWYSIRHSVGTFMTREEGMKAAKSQLRHRNIETTAKYDAAPVDDRRDALDRMG